MKKRLKIIGENRKNYELIEYWEEEIKRLRRQKAEEEEKLDK